MWLWFCCHRWIGFLYWLPGQHNPPYYGNELKWHPPHPSSSLPGTNWIGSRPVHYISSQPLTTALLDMRVCFCWFTRLTHSIGHAACYGRDWWVAVLNCWTLDSVLWHPGTRTEAWTSTHAIIVKDDAHQRCCWAFAPWCSAVKQKMHFLLSEFASISSSFHIIQASHFLQCI